MNPPVNPALGENRIAIVYPREPMPGVCFAKKTDHRFRNGTF